MKAVRQFKMLSALFMAVILMVAGALLMSGCATILSGTRQRIDIESSTEGSRITVFDKKNNKVLESGASSIAYLRRGGGFFSGGVYRVEITKEGYEPLITQISADINTGPYLAGNILLGGGWIGLLIVDPATGAMWNLSPQIIKSDLDAGTITVFNRSDWYFAARYGLPLGGLPQWGHINLESGRIWKNGVFCGTDFNFGMGTNENKYGERLRVMAGAGFDVGGVYDLPVDDLQFVYGGGVGFWFAGDYQERNNYDEARLNFNYLAPFVKLRYKFFELSYRGLLGTYVEERDYYYSSYDDYDYDSGFGWNNHQLTLGLYFEGSKRKGVTLQRR